MATPNPFDFVTAINSNKKDLFEEGYREEDYLPFLVNRQLSYFMDTIFFANEANHQSFQDVPKRAQFDFFRLSVEPRKRFAKWVKKADNADVEMLQRRYGGSRQVAEDMLKLLSKQELDALRREEYHGGRTAPIQTSTKE